MNEKGAIWTVVAVIVIFLVFAIIIGTIIEARLGEKIDEAIEENKIPTGPERSINCIDDDGGRNYFTFGTVTKDYSYTYNDVCDALTGKLMEYYCIDDRNESADYDCPNGCDGNACNSSLYTIDDCIDSDGGKNYFTYGILTKGTEPYEDKCQSIQGLSILLKEYYCYKEEDEEEVLVEHVIYQCPNGCENGACIV